MVRYAAIVAFVLFIAGYVVTVLYAFFTPDAEKPTHVSPVQQRARCKHTIVDPVELNDGTVVGTICSSCRLGLPANWACDACRWEDEEEPSGLTRRFCTSLCTEHL